MPTPTLTEIVGVPALPAGASNLQLAVVIDPPYQGGPNIGLSPARAEAVRSADGNRWVFASDPGTFFFLPLARQDVTCPAPDGWLRAIITYTIAGKSYRTETKAMRPQANGSGVLDLSQNQFPQAYIPTADIVKTMQDSKTATDSANAAVTRTLAARDEANTARDAAYAGRDAANNAAAAAALAAGMTLWAGGDHTTLPLTVGLYRIRDGSESGQVWQRVTSGGTITRRADLEPNPALSGARALRKAYNTSALTRPTAWYETDTQLPLTYWPGVGWRTATGGDPDYVAPPPTDTGDYT